MKKNIFLLAIAFITCSCATVFTGTRDTISFNSTPEGALVFKDGLELCKTPCRIPIKRSLNDVDIEFKLDGYETRLFTLDKEFNIVSVINFGNLLGWAIDAVSGSIMKYDRKSYELELKKKNLSFLENPREIHINTKQNIVDVYVMQK
jgi:hypothetical protein